MRDGVVEVELIEQRWLLTVQTTAGCGQVAGSLAHMLLLPPSFGVSRPTVLGLQARETRADDETWIRLYRWRFLNESWVVEPVDSDHNGEWTRSPEGLVPVVPVNDNQDWYVENESKERLTWVWEDPGDGATYTIEVPGAEESWDQGCAGHAVSSEKVYWFEHRLIGGFDQEFWLHTATLPSLQQD